MDKLDRDLEKLKNKNEEIPKVVLDSMENAFNEIREKKTKKNVRIKKSYIAAASLALVLLVGTSAPVRAAIERIFFEGNKGVENAAKEGYIQSVANEELKTEKFDVKLIDIVVDKVNIALSYEVSIKDKELMKNTEDISIEVSILDKNYNVSSWSTSTDKTDIEKGKLRANVFLTSQNGGFKDTDKLDIKVESIRFGKNEKDGIIYSLDNINWVSNISLSDKFKESIACKYKVVSENENIVIRSLEAIPTGTLIDFDYKVLGHNENIISNVFVVDEEGNKYKTNGVGSLESLNGGGDRLSTLIEGVSSFNAPDILYVEVNNPDGKNVDRVKLEKVK